MISCSVRRRILSGFRKDEGDIRVSKSIDWRRKDIGRVQSTQELYEPLLTVKLFSISGVASIFLAIRNPLGRVGLVGLCDCRPRSQIPTILLACTKVVPVAQRAPMAKLVVFNSRRIVMDLDVRFHECSREVISVCV